MLKRAEREGRTWASRLADPPAAPTGDAVLDVPHAAPLGSAVDDATAAYIAAMRDPFERLRQAEAQLAGLLVLATASGQPIAGHPMLDLASEAVTEAIDGIHALKVPEPAVHHHEHVLQAVRMLRLAVSAARRCLLRSDDAAVDAVFDPLRTGHQHLLWATSALPGFEIVALGEACCARHALARQPQ